MTETETNNGDSYANKVDREMIRRLGIIGDSLTSDVLRSRFQDYAAPTPALDADVKQPRAPRRKYRQPVALMALDALCALIATIIISPFSGSLLTIGFFPALWLGTTATYRLYQSRHYGRGSDEFRLLARATFAATACAALACSVLDRNSNEMQSALMVMPLAGALTVLARGFRRRFGAARKEVKRTLIVGSLQQVSELDYALRLRSELKPVAIWLTELPKDMGPADALRIPIVGVLDGIHDAEKISAAVTATNCDAVIALPGPQLGASAMSRISWLLAEQGISFFLAPLIRETSPSRLSVHISGTVPLLHLQAPELARAARLPKEIAERACALFALVAMAPILAGFALAILIGDGGPILFRQMRVGLNGRLFTLYKFRTMAINSSRAQLLPEDTHLFKLRNDPRVTRIGAVLRRYSLDELPQLFNVLTGTMSLVGPRPPLPEEAARYTDEIRRRLLVKPGLTGLWQVSGRSDLTWEEAVRLDLTYVENWSLALDAAILLRTGSATLKGTGAY